MPRTDRSLALWENKHGGSVPVPPKPRPRNNEESRSQRAVIEWWHTACAKLGVPELCLFKITNEGWRSHAASNVMRLEGMRSGAPDLMLAAARGNQHGLFIEMKKEDGVVSDNQREFLRALHTQGYYVTVAYNTMQAVNAIEDYLNS